MSQQHTSKIEAFFKSHHRNRQIEIRMGWDRAMQRHYLTIDFADGKRESVYRSDEDPNVSRYTDLTYYLRYLLSLGVRIPRDAVRAVSAAPLWSFDSKGSRALRSPRYAKS